MMRETTAAARLFPARSKIVVKSQHSIPGLMPVALAFRRRVVKVHNQYILRG
jgi:hypothetical protein